MLSSMTGFGKAKISESGITVSVEIKSLNNRFLEIYLKMPKHLQAKEYEIRELIRQKINRGKINVNISIEREFPEDIPLKINIGAVKSYLNFLKELKRAARIKDQIKLEHLLKFSEIIEIEEQPEVSEAEWMVIMKTIETALQELQRMRIAEGMELKKDFEKRIKLIDEKIDRIYELSIARINERKERLRGRIKHLIESSDVDNSRIELELVLLADKLDITEECTRFKSHVKFFLNSINSSEPAVGRKLNFLLQEMHREANTMSAKSEDAEISHLVVEIKEEIEKMREQIQNIE
jgi:uncharacterized protein (TIGR00255 family)